VDQTPERDAKVTPLGLMVLALKWIGLKFSRSILARILAKIGEIHLGTDLPLITGPRKRMVAREALAFCLLILHRVPNCMQRNIFIPLPGQL
jgi:hypothetical protein